MGRPIILTTRRTASATDRTPNAEMQTSSLLLPLLLALTASSAAACVTAEEWRRSGGPVLRAPVDGGGYEAASDPHVFWQDGGLHMIYAADDQGRIAIHLTRFAPDDAASDAPGAPWPEGAPLLGASTGHDAPLSKETPFHHQAANGEHQIYFVGYADEETYESDIYLAVSERLTGPYQILPAPVIKRGALAGRQVELITSPSVIEHDGVLHMLFLGWDGFKDVTQVWSLGAISTDNGRSWSSFQETGAPIGMEGQVTPAPDGRFAAVRASGHDGSEAIFIACANHPFGPYEAPERPILRQAGAPWEADETTAPQLTFHPETGAAALYYTGADHQRGWWIMSAAPAQ